MKFRAITDCTDVFENILIKEGAIIEREGKRAEDFMRSPWFVFVKDDEPKNEENKAPVKKPASKKKLVSRTPKPKTTKAK